MNTNSARTPLIARAVEDPVLNREVGFTVAQREALDNPSQAVQGATWQPACAAKVFVMSALGSVSGRRVRRIKHLPLRHGEPHLAIKHRIFHGARYERRPR